MENPTLVACHAMPQTAQSTLAIDIGGSGLKAAVLDESGEMTSERVRIDTPVGATPDAIVAALFEMTDGLPKYTRIGAGFPGMVRDGVVRTAPNLRNEAWQGFDLAAALSDRFGCPARVGNDADVQGLAVVAGKGIEMVMTLGTGFGTALYDKGRLCPHLEISQQPFRKGENYDEHLGNFARKAVGNEKWHKRVLRAIDNMRELVHFDHAYLGGGNAKKLGPELPDDVTVVSNEAGLSGCVVLWRDD